MNETQTFIFMDLETTGLPSVEKSPTKITEMSLVAVSRMHILDKHNELYLAKENKLTGDRLPRVLNKITIDVYPDKMIHPIASTLTGLTNENLEKQSSFDESLFNLLILFLERLEKPFCVIAHNGNKFDFPVLQSEILKIGKQFPDDLFCADSLPGLREILTKQQEPEHWKSHQTDTVLSGIKPLSSTSNVNKAIDLLPKCSWSNEEYDNEMAQAVELAEKFVKEQDSFNVDELEAKINQEMERRRKINENTPVRKKVIPNHVAREHGARRNLMNDKSQPKIKYNMNSLYENLTGKKLVDAHRAEADALALLECVTAVGLPILEWLDKNRIPLKSIKKMW